MADIYQRHPGAFSQMPQDVALDLLLDQLPIFIGHEGHLIVLRAELGFIAGQGARLAVLRGDKPRGKTQRENVILTWRDAGTPKMQAAMTGSNTLSCNCPPSAAIVTVRSLPITR